MKTNADLLEHQKIIGYLDYCSLFPVPCSLFPSILYLHLNLKCYSYAKSARL
ncbi:hypothetical protein [Moorena producens]|uniref:hypothetical protein n=1 Tax=Moorena producens TaxID=1155739 RepID=UPI001314B0A6|nr:hypothetical protein [Moorena producens]